MKFKYPDGQNTGPTATVKLRCPGCAWHETRPHEQYEQYWCVEPTLPEAKCMGGDAETPEWCPRLKVTYDGLCGMLRDLADGKSRTIMFDPKINHAHSCPFFEEYLDQTACGEGWGFCRVYPQLMENPDAELACPKLGPRGGPKAEAPDDCPLRAMDLCITKTKKVK